MPKLNLDAIEQVNSTTYPPSFAAPVGGRWSRRLAPHAGLTELGASHVVLKPGAWSSHRHWHDNEDEMVIMLAGEAVLVEDAARTPLRAGDIATFAKGIANGHHLINESAADCAFVAISAGQRTTAGYSDIDMIWIDGGYARRDGQPY